MTLTEVTPVALADLPVLALKSHLRLGSGFAEADLQEDLLASFLRAALAAIEARISKAILARSFELQLTRWATPAAQALPLAPVTMIEAVTLFTATGGAEVVDPSRYQLLPDSQRPALWPVSGSLPAIPGGGHALVRLTAGFGPWDAVPPDLAQAVLMLAAHYYEYRDDTGLKAGCMPFGVTALIERHRQMRLGGIGASDGVAQ